MSGMAWRICGSDLMILHSATEGTPHSLFQTTSSVWVICQLKQTDVAGLLADSYFDFHLK